MQSRNYRSQQTQSSSWNSYIKEEYGISASDSTRNSLRNLNMHQQCWPHNYWVVPPLSDTNRVQVCLCSICMRDMCFPCQHFHYHPAVATCQIQNMVSTVLSCSYHTSFVLASALLTCWASGRALCSIPSLVVIFSGLFLGIHFSWIYYFLGNKSSSLASILAWNA